jgi:GDP-L-fucose synthase
LRDLARHRLLVIVKLTGFTGRIVWDTSRPNGQPRRCLDVSRAQRAFGFRARTDFEDGLAGTVAWYRRHYGLPTAAGS